jgi:hypothetical protein
MKVALRIAVAMLLSMFPVSGQSVFNDPLLDRMVGNWILEGTIEGKPTTHEVAVEWVLSHQYLRLHEVSREKDAKGLAAYEAIIFLGWDERSKEYACLWLDNTGGGGLAGQAIGHAKRSGNEMAFLFKGGNGSLFHTTFVYDKGTNTWQWGMDGEEGGKLQPFARLKLGKK